MQTAVCELWADLPRCRKQITVTYSFGLLYDVISLLMEPLSRILMLKLKKNINLFHRWISLIWEHVFYSVQHKRVRILHPLTLRKCKYVYGSDYFLVCGGCFEKLTNRRRGDEADYSTIATLSSRSTNMKTALILLCTLSVMSMIIHISRESCQDHGRITSIYSWDFAYDVLHHQGFVYLSALYQHMVCVLNYIAS